MRTDEFDLQIEGQMHIEDLFQPPERLIAIHRIFARARKEMSLAEQQVFTFALSKLKFKKEAVDTNVYLEKKVLAEILHINSDPRHLSQDIYENIKHLPEHSRIEIAKRDRNLYTSGMVVTDVTVTIRNTVRIGFNKNYMGLFTGLTTDYITLWTMDIFKMTSKRSVQFYELLRQLTDTRVDVNQHGWGVKQFKEMFGIPKDGKGSYMRKDGHFDRSAFEKYVIQPLCDDLKKCKMINLVIQPDGKCYEKVKSGNRVVGYRFYWTFTAYPKVASAAEVHEIQQRVDKDPQVLKVTKDIIKGEKRGSGSKNNPFNQFEQNEYDFDELEKELLSN